MLKTPFSLVNVNITDWIKWGYWRHQKLFYQNSKNDQFIKMKDSKMDTSGKYSDSLTLLKNSVTVFPDLFLPSSAVGTA